MSLQLNDLSTLPRFGLKGTAVDAHLASHRIEADIEFNCACLQEDNRLVARLGRNEYLVMANPDEPGHMGNSTAPENHHQCHVVPRFETHYCFAIVGSDAPSMLAKICGVDLDPQKFTNGQVAQTHVARTSAILIRHDLRSSSRYLLLGDRSLSGYTWNCIVDAGREFSG